ncbi:hypothetical protein CTEN210_08280 [Chaetoceros tenuissimus]|uniref:Diphthine--ammonia ligase n=1 Tax=Chaetoceros tenuissimus TaxID=426638 RepID=A0AAD3CU12_9STRA|nr:hypothetical protein CTEN210_08280 [Chaetoceros tenuissimus]
MGGEDLNGSIDSSMRICSLLPSVTDICIALGLADYLVAVTHECDFESINRNRTNEKDLHIVTKSGLNPNLSQREIDDAVKSSSQSGHGDVSSISLYPIIEEKFLAAKPTIVLTQNLCQVCAPTPKGVKSIINTCSMDPNIAIHSFEPHSLEEVVTSFGEVANVLGVPERGEKMIAAFKKRMDDIRTSCLSLQAQRKVLLLEWLDPPYDAGHWIPDMIAWCGCETVRIGNESSKKSKTITWDDVYDADPDVIMIACCGFDLKRNINDIHKYINNLKSTMAAKENKIFACNGDMNFARPGPFLLDGIAVIAKCVYGEEHTRNIRGFSEKPLEWQRVDINDIQKQPCTKPSEIIDIEDIGDDYVRIHKEACDAGEMTYIDPKTQYQVFTELAHKKRGKCCGAGCRHCPFNHENVRDKAKRIQQPAFLFESSKDDYFVPIKDSQESEIKVLFFSGGKDSFLALRALVKNHRERADRSKLCIVLLTSFDAESRVIAHQEVSIETVTKQASHLNISLLGVPMHRGTSETYVDRISLALDVIRQKANLANISQINSIVFGDLNLAHIRGWRDTELSKFGIQLEYPLWKASYNDLFEDLEKSSVEVDIAASTKDYVAVDQNFSRNVMKTITENNGDAFGENGEFHTVAKVWVTTREQALGLSSHT